MTTPRYLFDSDGPATDLPKNAQNVAGYKDGAGNFDEFVKAFPHAGHVSISIHGAKAKCYDMENGTQTIQSGCACAKRDIDAGDEWPWLYFSVSNHDAVKAECERLGIWGKVILWGAHYGVADKLPAGYHALQNVAAGYGATGHWDRSILADHIPGFDPPLKPVKHPGHAPSPFIPVMADAVKLATEHYLGRKKDKRPMDAAAIAKTHRLIEAASSALVIK